jgi:hypothetical protein
VPRRRAGDILVRETRGARDERDDRPAQPARRDRQRQWHEFTSSAVLAFTQASGLDWRYIAPGKPT